MYRLSDEKIVFDRRNVPPPSDPTEGQLYRINKDATKLRKILENIFGSKERALEELREIKTDKNCATFYIGLLKLKKEKRRAFEG
jgi:hypothetical protein